MKKIIRISTSAITAFAVFILSFLLCLGLSYSDKVYLSDGSMYLSRMISVEDKDDDILTSVKSSGSNKNVFSPVTDIINHSSRAVRENDRKFLIPGGNLVGIRLKTDGVLVVGTECFDTFSGSASPADDAGIMVGDTLKTVEDIKISDNSQLSEIIASSGGNPLDVEIIRNGEVIALTLTPEISAVTGDYKCGLWIRDSTGGIGTLTYCDAENGSFGSLGHGIYDSDTGKIIPTEKGEICDVTLNGVTKGTNGTAGELRGVITGDSYGNIISNNENGIYGNLDIISGSLDILPVAFPDEVTTGKAEIISTVRDNKTEKFEIEIERINKSAENKNFIIKVTDEELLGITGGIVQGMSGSPIIQNGRIVGAVTHVFVNDPTRGYGIFIDNMLNAAS